MKTKTIFKALAFVIVMPAMLLTTACSSSDDSIINDENINKKGFALPVTVNVTRQGDKANTRATYNETTKKLEFSDGDQLFVNGIHPDAGYFAGTLDRVSGGTFSGTIITAREYSDTAEKLLNEASASGEDNFASATLLPSGYEEYDYFFYDTILEIFDIVNWDENNAFARSKAEAVEQFTVEQAEKYENGFALSPTNAILSFTITGLTANTNVKVLLENIYSLAIKGEVTTDDLGTATFAIGLWAGTDLQNYSLTVGGTEIALTSTSKTLEAGHIYNINRSAAPALAYTMAANATAEDKGKLICTAGHIHAYGEDAECTADRVAKIIYVGETGDATYTHGLALALSDEGQMNWNTALSTCSSKNTSVAVTNASWMLASKDQWNYMLDSNGAGSYTSLRDGFNSVDGTNLQSDVYWSSTERDASNAGAYSFGFGGWFGGFIKSQDYVWVRACLAF